MSFPVTVGLTSGQEKQSGSDGRGRPLGTRGVTEDGRVFYWSLAGASALRSGSVVQTKVSPGASVHVAALDVVGATTTGVSTLTVTIATTPITADQYKDGYLTIDTSPGQAMYKIKSHLAADSATDAEFTFADNEKLLEPLTSGTTKVGLRENPYSSVVAFPTTATGVAAGVAPISVTAGHYFWAQTYGPAIVNTDAAPVAGESIIVPGATAGNATVNAATSADVGDNRKQVIGYSPTAGAGADKYNYVFLTIRA